MPKVVREKSEVNSLEHTGLSSRFFPDHNFVIIARKTVSVIHVYIGLMKNFTVLELCFLFVNIPHLNVTANCAQVDGEFV